MLTFRMIAFDAQTIPVGIQKGYTCSFFNDDLNFEDESAAKQDEKAILKWLFMQPELKKCFLRNY